MHLSRHSFDPCFLVDAFHPVPGGTSRCDDLSRRCFASCTASGWKFINPTSTVSLLLVSPAGSTSRSRFCGVGKRSQRSKKHVCGASWLEVCGRSYDINPSWPLCGKGSTHLFSCFGVRQSEITEVWRKVAGVKLFDAARTADESHRRRVGDQFACGRARNAITLR